MHEARDRSVDVRSPIAACTPAALVATAGQHSEGASRTRSSTRTRFARNASTQRGTIGNGDVSRRVSRVARVRARRSRRARVVARSIDGREEEGFSPRVFLPPGVAIARRRILSRRRVERWRFGASWTPRGRVREVGRVRARLRTRATRANRLRDRLPPGRTATSVFSSGRRAARVRGASRARRRGPPRRRRRARGERASGDDSSRARGASGGSRDSSSSPRGV